ncbi:MAG: hypothetical protein EON55_29240, partial [Alphaproteobacteria bacterium]
MVDAADNDILVYFVAKEGSDPIKGESSSALGVGGVDAELMKNFKDGYYSEAETFSFTMDLGDDEGGVSIALSDNRSFARWRGLTDASVTPDPPFRAEPGLVSITRMIDVSSPLLLEHCLKPAPFASVVVVKRAPRGTLGKMTVLMRLEFKRVFIQSIQWNDGDTVIETCQFKFMSLDASYRKFKPNGNLDSIK